MRAREIARDLCLGVVSFIVGWFVFVKAFLPWARRAEQLPYQDTAGECVLMIGYFVVIFCIAFPIWYIRRPKNILRHGR